MSYQRPGQLDRYCPDFPETRHSVAICLPYCHAQIQSYGWGEKSNSTTFQKPLSYIRRVPSQTASSVPRGRPSSTRPRTPPGESPESAQPQPCGAQPLERSLPPSNTIDRTADTRARPISAT